MELFVKQLKGEEAQETNELTESLTNQLSL